MHDALLTHHTDFYHSPCRGHKCSDKYCACAALSATPDQKGTSGRCYIAAVAPKGAWRRCKYPPDATFFVLIILPSDMVSCRQDTAPSADHTRHWNDTNKRSIMGQLMVSFQCWAGSTDEDINLFLVGGKTRQTKRVRPGDVILPQRRRKVHGGGANSPPMQPSLCW